MEDRELLELAAKAAGCKAHVSQSVSGGLLLEDQTFFDPLNDDGDALRLAVKLDLNVFQSAGRAYAMESNGEDNGLYTSHLSDKYAATRRAIVRAAAEIGRSM